ncbi:MAG: DUF3828 domain-containing protein [Pyrinomonadaceae bacterium]
MKNLLFGFLLSIALASCASAQAAGPEQAAKDFYKWYLTELNANRDPISKSKTRMLKSVSKRLGAWVYSPANEEYGADYFLDLQDYDETWVNGITATPAVKKGTVATFKIIMSPKKGVFSGFGKHTLALKMVKENGFWKIDSVNNRKLTR